MRSGVREFHFEPARQRGNRTAEGDGLLLFFGCGLERTTQTAVIVIEPELYENFILIGQGRVRSLRMACLERCFTASLDGFGDSEEHAHGFNLARLRQLGIGYSSGRAILFVEIRGAAFRLNTEIAYGLSARGLVPGCSFVGAGQALCFQVLSGTPGTEPRDI